MIGVDMVADRKTKAPLDKTITRALFHEALERGLITMSYSNVIRINPPLVITEDEALQRGRHPRSVLRRHRAAAGLSCGLEACKFCRRTQKACMLRGAFIGFGNVAANGPHARLARPGRCPDRRCD